MGAGGLEEQYYFHPDHLGSSNYITNIAGDVSQHMEYFAFGETFVEEHKNSINSPFKFNGKELDEESGLYYYGARYYDPKLSIWASVDPLAEKFVGRSSYEYCFNNPINLIDPNGLSISDPVKKIISKNEVGNINQTTLIRGPKEYGPPAFLVTTSDRSNNGMSIVYSKMQDDSSLFEDVFFGAPEWNQSVSMEKQKVVGQYFDANGNKVLNSNEATRFIEVEETTTTTIKLDMQSIDNIATVNKSKKTTTYDIIKSKTNNILVNKKITVQKFIPSKIKSNIVDKKLQQQAQKASNENFIEAAKVLLDKAGEIQNKMDENFNESLKKL